MGSTQPDSRRTVLITGCSTNGLGHALAIAFHNAGLRVFATARNPAKMSGLAGLGIECLQLDVLDQGSIDACVAEVAKRTSPTGDGTGGRLDCLVNNAGGGMYLSTPFLAFPSARTIDPRPCAGGWANAHDGFSATANRTLRG
jgi:1-acylglycerone phosphate reductase